MTCPLCEETSTPRFRRHGFLLRDCPACDHRFADAAAPTHDEHVAAVYGDHYFETGDGYPAYLDDAAIHRARGRAYARLLTRHLAGAPPGRLLDVGAAAGFVLQGFVDEGWRGVALEPNAAMAAHARAVLGLDTVVGSLESATLDGPFDAVNLIQVLPHFVDVRAAVARTAGLLRPGGLCLVECWDRRSWTALLFGRWWHEYNPPSVLHWFTCGSLVRLMAQHDLEAVASGRPRRRISVAHAVSAASRALLGPTRGAAVGDRLGRLVGDRVVPYPGNDLVWLLFRRGGA